MELTIQHHLKKEEEEMLVTILKTVHRKLKVFEVEVDRNKTVWALKKLIEDMVDIAAPRQVFISRKKEEVMVDSKTMADYDLKDKSVLILL